MRPYSFTRYGGVEFELPIYRTRITDELVFKDSVIELSRGSYNPNRYSLVPKMKPWELSMTLKAEAPATVDYFADMVTLAFSGNGIYKVRMDDGTFRQREVIINSFTRSMAQREFGLLPVKVSGQVFPYWLSTVQNTQTLTGAGGTITTTSLYPCVEGLYLVLSGAPGNQTIVITNTTNGNSFNLFMGAGVTYTIDVGANIMTKGTSVNYRKDITILTQSQIDVFKLEPGANVITIAGGTASLLVKWSNTWL